MRRRSTCGAPRSSSLRRTAAARPEIMRRSGKSKPVVWTWQARFMAERVDGLTRDKTRKPGKPPLPAATVQRVVDLALGPPPAEATHWTGRMLAKAAGVSLRSVQRILDAHQLAPHRIRTFKLSNDPKYPNLARATFESKLKRGDSGSPVFDASARLLGLLARLDDDNPEIGLIVPIVKAKVLIPEIETPSGCN